MTGVEIRAEELPAAASTAKCGESLSFGTALRPINGEMPAALNVPFMFSGTKAFCQAGFINGRTSERAITSEALIASQCIPFLRTLKQLRVQWLKYMAAERREDYSNSTLCSPHNFATSTCSCLWRLPCPSRHRRNHPYCSNGCHSRSCRRNIVRYLTNELSPLGVTQT